MEAELLAAHGPRLEDASAGLTALLDFARARSAIDYVHADRRLDALVVQARALFDHHDVLLLPTAPMPPPPRDAGEHAGLADFCALASLAGCPALSLPLPGGIGLQLVGPRGSDLRLLELGEVLASVIAPWEP
jgi:Asp-tRNA(Asn)/Glu-tRNA(Gln) amidotransferase A subunit family amidase